MVIQQEEIIKITETLIDSISRGDFAAYEKFCDPNMTAFEPESLGHLVTGMSFHKFYFDNLLYHKPTNTTLIEPRVHILGDDFACIAYIRLTQFLDKEGLTHSTRVEETRVWRRSRCDDKGAEEWRCIHFHRSNIANGNSSSSTSGTTVESNK